MMILPIMNRLDALGIDDPLLARAWEMVEKGGDIEEFASIIYRLEALYPIVK